MGVRVVNKSTRQVLMTFYGGYSAIQAGNELRIVNKGTVVQKFDADLVEYNLFFILTSRPVHYHGDNAECVDAEFIVSSPAGDVTTVELWHCKSCGEYFSKRTTQTRKEFEGE